MVHIYSLNTTGLYTYHTFLYWLLRPDLKGTPSENISCLENVENITIFPSANFSNAGS